MAELIEGASTYAEARCPLPACGETLHIAWSGQRAIYLSDTAEMLRDPAGAHTTTWRVECEAGHVVLLPPDDGDDYHHFAGICMCNEDYPDQEAERMCEHNDMARLRALVQGAAAAKAGGNG